MTLSRKEALGRLIDFTNSSIGWCSEKSEEAALQVIDVLNEVIEEAERIANTSEESLNDLRKVMQTAEDNESLTMRELKQMLEGLAARDHTIQGQVYPVIQTLQFQDRLQQNIQNTAKMMDIWMHFKADHEVSAEDNLNEFGKRLMEMTTMADERKILRKHVPTLEEEDESIVEGAILL